MRFCDFIASAAAALTLTSSAAIAQQLPSVPASPAGSVSDNYFGVAVADPYRWLEDGNSPAVRDWQASQDAYTRQVLDALPQRDALRSELAAFFNRGTITPPVPAGGWLFYTERLPGANQPALHVQKDAIDRVIVDPNTLSSDGSVSLDWFYPSNDGTYVAYGTSNRGDEDSTLHVVRTSDGRVLPDSITRARSAYVAWTARDVFYYTRFDPADSKMAVGRRVYLHHLGKNPDGSGDADIYGDRNAVENWPFVASSPDGRWLILGEPYGSSFLAPVTLQIRDLTHPHANPIIISGKPEARWSPDFDGSTLYVVTNLNAPRNRLLKIDLRHPSRANWKTIVPESSDTLESATYADGHLVVNFLHNVHSEMRVYTVDGHLQRSLPTPVLGSADCCQFDDATKSIFYGFTSFSVPSTIYRYEMKTGRLLKWSTLKQPFGDQPVVVEQKWYASKDGTRVPMFLVHQQRIAKSARNPVLLYGYGGFGVSQKPTFTVPGADFVAHGGIYAVANIRGGGEFGIDWHRAGMLEQKQNTFDDFESAARWLINERYTSSDRLAIIGASNGGLLTAAVETQTPELFGAVVSLVPLTDMLRYQNSGYGKEFVSEYGASDTEQAFKYLLAYSPYHNIRSGTSYPATLVTTAQNDVRVDPLHARKFVARLQQENKGRNPILLRVEKDAGHSKGTPVDKLVEQYTDVMSFVYTALHMETP